MQKGRNEDQGFDERLQKRTMGVNQRGDVLVVHALIPCRRNRREKTENPTLGVSYIPIFIVELQH